MTTSVSDATLNYIVNRGQAKKCLYPFEEVITWLKGFKLTHQEWDYCFGKIFFEFDDTDKNIKKEILDQDECI